MIFLMTMWRDGEREGEESGQVSKKGSHWKSRGQERQFIWRQWSWGWRRGGVQSVVLIGLMRSQKQGKGQHCAHSWASALRNWRRWLAFTRVREWKRVVGLWGPGDEVLNMSCGYIGNTLDLWDGPQGTPYNGFHTLFSTWAKYISKKKKNISVLYVYTLCFCFYKLFRKAHISWLDWFVKRIYDHQGEVTPTLITNEESWTRGRKRKALGHPFSLVILAFKKKSLWSSPPPQLGQSDGAGRHPLPIGLPGSTSFPAHPPAGLLQGN